MSAKGFAKYVTKKVIASFLIVVIATYLTVIIANMGGHVDEIVRGELEIAVSQQFRQDPRYDGYYAGACTFEMLESQSLAFVTRLIKIVDKFNSKHNGLTNDGFYIKEIMSDAFDDDLTSFFVEEFGYREDDLKMDYEQLKPQVEACPESCDDSNLATADICQYSASASKCKNIVIVQ